MPPGTDTVYIAAADGEGNVVSLITSVFDGFGSGIVDDATGIVMQNRAANFSLDPASPNVLAAGKRPYHTISPGLITNGTDACAFGVMGGMMQPQGHVQVVHQLVDLGMSPQEALDAPRLRVNDDGSVDVEPALENAVSGLARRGHRARVNGSFSNYGGGQIVGLQDGLLVGGSAGRKDGLVAAY